MFRDYGDLYLKFALSLPHDISQRSAAKFRSLALDEAPMEVIRMKVLCVCVWERERESGGGKQTTNGL